MWNNKKNNSGTTEEQQRNTDNNDNNIYLFLFNKYMAKIQKINSKDFGARIRIITELKNERDYNELLTSEEQNKLFNELMNG